LFGAVLGIALMNKYSAGFLAFFLFIGMLFTRMRIYFTEKAFWSGMLIAFLIFLPHILWQVQNGMPTLEFIENAKTMKMVRFGALDYIIQQALIAQPLFYLLSLAGLVYTLANRNMRKYSAVPIAYLLLLVFFIVTGGKPYYIAAIFPALFAFGALALRRLIYHVQLLWLRAVSIGVVVIAGIATMPMGLPVLPPEQLIDYQKAIGVELTAAEKNQTAALHQPYAGMFGWREMAATVSRVYRQLPDEEKRRCVVYGSTYAVAGAMEYYDRQFELPPAVSLHNSYWTWGLPDRRIDVMIFIGGRKSDLGKLFESCEKAAYHHHKWAMPHVNNLIIWICRHPKVDLEKYWRKNRKFI
jgi:4-amino-4-deoxy-L-arabinose transferase-like glycosyltransferase